MRTLRFTPDAMDGLSSGQVRLRAEEGLVNAQPERFTRTTGRILRDNLLTFFNLINLLIFLALLLVRSYANLLFIGVAFCNLLIGVTQELRAKRAVEKLTFLCAPRAKVIRDGKEEDIPSAEIVLDDVLLLSLGDQVPCDAVVLMGTAEADESLLTGESGPVAKKPGDTLLSGSFLLSGACRAQADKVGEDSYAAALAQEAKRYKRFDSTLMKSLRIIIRVAGGVVLPLGLLLFLHAYLGLAHTLESSVEQAAAAMIGMIPSGLMLLTSVSLAAGVVKLSRRKTLVQEMYCIETLARVDTLCLDKTGTLTTGNMRVEKIVAASPAYESTLYAKMCDAVQTMPAQNATAKALLKRFPDPPKIEPVGMTPFSSARRYSAVSFRYGTLYLGAVRALYPVLPPALRREAEAAAASGRRVLLLAQSAYAGPQPPIPEQADLFPLALVILSDELRPEAEETLRFFREEGVTVKLISGDDPETVSAIAGRLNLPGAEAYVDVSMLRGDEAVEAAAETYTVFGRVSPERKKLLIAAMKAEGHTVAMTGDGVNDVLALKEADCSVALAAGSGAARQISQLVLLENDFSSLPHIVMEGRRVVNNITRMASLFLVKTIFSFLLTVSSLAFGLAYPFQPVQLTLISMVSVGIPSFILALEPNRARIRGSFLRNVLARAVPGALCIFLFSLFTGLLGRRLGLAYPEVNSLSVLIAGTAGLMVLLRVCMPLDWPRGVLCALMAAAFFLVFLLLPRTLEVAFPAGPALWMYLGMALVCYPLLVGLERASQHILKAEV